LVSRPPLSRKNGFFITVFLKLFPQDMSQN